MYVPATSVNESKIAKSLYSRINGKHNTVIKTTTLAEFNI